MLRRLGFDSLAPYHWIHFRPIPDHPHSDYARYRDASFAEMARQAAQHELPMLPVACAGWDSLPRTPQDQELRRAPYPWGPVLTGNTPAEFGKALRMARTWLDERPRLPRVVLVEAWNEWTEGSYLEPDAEHGFGFLEELRRFRGERPR
jgi:hypothetical protein